jgi:hypothetical protein
MASQNEVYLRTIGDYNILCLLVVDVSRTAIDDIVESILCLMNNNNSIYILADLRSPKFQVTPYLRQSIDRIFDVGQHCDGAFAVVLAQNRVYLALDYIVRKLAKWRLPHWPGKTFLNMDEALTWLESHQIAPI